MRRRRAHKRSAQLTPLIDVLFIMLFAALIQARGHSARPEPGAASADAGPPDAGPADAGVADAGPDAAALDASLDAGPGPHLAQSRRVAEIVARAVRNRDAFVVEISAGGEVLSMKRWSGGEIIQRDNRREGLLRPPLPGEPVDEMVYRGVRKDDMRICSLVHARFASLSDELELPLVLIILDTPRDELPLALDRGLAMDLTRCRDEAGFVGILIDPGDLDHAIP